MKVMTCLALAGLASAAMGQSASLNIVASQSTINPSQTGSMTLSVYGSADFGTHIGGGEFALVDGASGSGIVTGMDASAVGWAAVGENDRGWGGGSNYTGLVFGQFIFLPPFPPAPESSFENGQVLLATISVEFQSPEQFWTPVDFNLGVGIGPFVLEIFDEADGSLTQLSAGEVSFGSARVLVVPAPSSVALLGLGGLVAGRRRR